MSNDSISGLPLLSGPPPPTPPAVRADIGCRKCGKEFNVLFCRSRKCNHCGYHYCTNCTDFQALMPRSGRDGIISGHDVTNVCGFCIEFLSITAFRRNKLKTLPLAKLKKYVAAYNIQIRRAVEKEDFVDAIEAAKRSNGCLPPENENYYRTYSVPDRTNYDRRSFFSNARPPPPPPPPPRQPPRQPTADFARPDLTPDSSLPLPPRPSSYRPTPPTAPRPQANRNYPGPPPQPSYESYPYAQYNTDRYAPSYHAPPPPPPPQNSRPNGQWPGFSRSSQNLHSEYNSSAGSREAPRPRATSTTNSTPPRPAVPPRSVVPPTLDELVEMVPDAISALSVSILKAVLFANHVNAGNVLEKEELVKKVSDLIEDEKRERQRQREADEQEEAERITLQHELMMERERKLEEERERANKDKEASESSRASTKPVPPKSIPVHVERSGLCVVCQDEEANIAIVDCGHMAMCRGCSELIMASSRECPLCRQRIITEARLLRIFKA